MKLTDLFKKGKEIKKERKDFLKVLEKVSREHGSLLQGRQDINSLLQGKQGRDSLTISEVYTLRNYAKIRTRLDIDEDLLSDEELAWKILYSTYNDAYRKHMDPEALSKVDQAEKDMYYLNLFKAWMEKFIALARETNNLFNKQLEYFEIHFKDSEYRKKEETYGKLMISKEKTKEERLKYAELILQLSKNYREQLVSPLSNLNEELQVKIHELEHPDMKSLMDLDSAQEIKELYFIFRELYFNNIPIVNRIINGSEWDEMLPKSVIEDKDGEERQWPKAVVEYMAESTMLSNQAITKIPALDKKRKKLSEGIDPKSNKNDKI
jgi:hypothetical protein